MRLILCQFKVHFSSETGLYPFKKHTRQRIQLLLNSIRVLTFKIFENLIRIALENQIVKPPDILVVFGSVWQLVLTTLLLSPQTTLLDNEFIRC